MSFAPVLVFGRSHVVNPSRCSVSGHIAKDGVFACTVGVKNPRTVLYSKQPTQELREAQSRSRREVLVGGSTVVACGASSFNAQASVGSAVQPQTQDRSELSPVKESPPTYVKAPGRIVAVGDLHGDVLKTIHSLELAGVLHLDGNGKPTWCGGNTTLVQMGDVLDRGDCEIGILMLLRDLQKQAEQEGGALYMLNGNHETMNVCGNFRYVTKGAFYECALASGLTPEAASIWDQQVVARVGLYSPGGILAKELAKNPTVLVVNDTVFAHGGLLPIHLNYGLERINMEMAAWMRGDEDASGGKATPPYIAMGGPHSIMWNRTLGQEVFKTQYERYHACSMAKSVLCKLGAKRLVVGHTPQMAGCNCECGGQVWRVDVGMSRGVLNAGPQALVIEQDEDGCSQIEVLRANADDSRPHGQIQTAPPRCALAPPARPKSGVRWKLFEWVNKATTVKIQKVEGGI